MTPVGVPIRRFGVREGVSAKSPLSRQRSETLSVVTAGHNAVTSLAVFSAVVLFLGAIGMAFTLQAWDQRVYDHPS